MPTMLGLRVVGSWRVQKKKEKEQVCACACVHIFDHLSFALGVDLSLLCPRADTSSDAVSHLPETT